MVGHLPPKAAVGRAIKLVASKHVKVSPPSDYRGEETLVLNIAQLVMAAAKYKLLPRRKLASVLGRYLPKDPPRALCSRFQTEQGRRFAYLRAHSVRASLRSETVEQTQVAEPKLKKLLNRKGYQSDGDLVRFEQQTAALLPWHKLWCDFELGRIQECQMGTMLNEAAVNSRKAEDRLYGERSATVDEIASIWSMILSAVHTSPGWQSLADWRDNLKHPLPVYVSVNVIRRAARSGNAAAALDWASYASILHSPVREDAESKADGFLSISRAILVASEAEAKHYFDQAVMAGAEIGQENLSRWTALIELALACRMDGFDHPELAYGFSRAAELTEQHDASQKYFDWDGTVRALAALSPRSVPAILSRWADRRVGDQGRLAPAAFLGLAREGHLTGNSCFALLPFRWRWTYSELLEQAFASAQSETHLSVREGLFFRYVQHLRLGSREWSKIGDVLSGAGLSPHLAHEQMAQMELREKIERDRTKDHYRTPSSSAKTAKEVDLTDIDWTTAGGILDANERFKKGEGWLEPSKFFATAIKATPVGKEPALFGALDEAGLVHLYDLSSLLSTVPVSWRRRPAVNAALDELILSTFKRDCFSVQASNLFQVLSLEDAVAGSGLTKQGLASEVVRAIASSSVDPGSQAMFQLAGLLAILLNPEEAKDALKTALEFYEQFHEAEDGDGPWSEALEPPESVSESLAGYVFAALGSPEPSRRWEAAHCIYLLASVGDKEMLRNIISFAMGGQATAFHGHQLFFYELNAQQWLMIGLARSALDKPEAIGAVADYLRSKATRSNQHVLIRHFAAKALRELARGGALSLGAAEVSKLSMIDEGALPPLDVANRGHAPDHADVERKYEDARFHFDIDFRKYYMSPLASAFGLFEAEIEIEAERVIADDWGLTFSGRYDEDERAKRGFFSRL
ncbi:hypothetical protein GRI44_07265 [Altererythrobacter confluentis]|uniref:Uncharacterized protein n=1 Tax=Allopontixanthobacter confluentis TaxID=1849021 RepID=A0A6L7GGE5_9SPHN|nr:hypothetical protein [Allopontixanthobacter confluentis]MXP14546.1 hypothetical protein [Allopontixanthobacter confluentis]